MYCTSNPKLIEIELDKAQATIARLTGHGLPLGFKLASPERNSVEIVRLSQAEADQLSCAQATMRAYDACYLCPINPCTDAEKTTCTR